MRAQVPIADRNTRNASPIGSRWATAITGELGVRAVCHQPKYFVGMILTLIFAGVMGLYGLIVALTLRTSAGNIDCFAVSLSSVPAVCISTSNCYSGALGSRPRNRLPSWAASNQIAQCAYCEERCDWWQCGVAPLHCFGPAVVWHPGCCALSGHCFFHVLLGMLQPMLRDPPVHFGRIDLRSSLRSSHAPTRTGPHLPGPSTLHATTPHQNPELGTELNHFLFFFKIYEVLNENILNKPQVCAILHHKEDAIGGSGSWMVWCTCCACVWKHDACHADSFTLCWWKRKAQKD